MYLQYLYDKYCYGINVKNYTEYQQYMANERAQVVTNEVYYRIDKRKQREHEIQGILGRTRR